MSGLKRAQEPFQFQTRLNLSELTGLRAATLVHLAGLLKEVPGACIYHHTHRFLQQHQYISPEPPNDFAYWVTEVLGEDELGEKLASIDTIQYGTIRQLREKIVATIEEYLSEHKTAHLRFSQSGEEFHFMKSISFVLPTRYKVYDLKEFEEALRKVTIDSIYFHVFEARLRLERINNDFSNWIEHSLGDIQLARMISRLDPYTQTMEGLRTTLLNIIKERITE